tara:strand:+ start:4075 stop:4461 length:387 start_codon:yes stop_codon:yes gene_type:complete
MDLNLTPDTYTPSVNDEGQYIDSIPIIKHGLYCLCGSRKDKIYTSTSKFGAHIKTKKHKKWLDTLNNNKANFYVELLKAKDTISSQQKIIADLGDNLQKKSMTIDYLTEQLTQRPVLPTENYDLLGIN